jgi:hypothetical protein
MTDFTARFGFPFILPGQAQKEAFHNEALVAIDAVLHPATTSGPLAAPPADPELGRAWLIAAGASAAWAGKDHHIAHWTQGGWRFTSPFPGLRIWSEPLALWIHWTGTGWSEGEIPAARIMVNGQQVVGARLPAVPSPSGGTVIDAEARAALAGVIATLKSHGLTD